MQSGNIVLLLLWRVLHLILRVLYFAREIFRAVESYLITNGYVKTYNDLKIDRVKYLGIVVDSNEARKTSKVIELLEWLSAIGVKKVCLYDREGKSEITSYTTLGNFDPFNYSWVDMGCVLTQTTQIKKSIVMILFVILSDALIIYEFFKMTVLTRGRFDPLPNLPIVPHPQWSILWGDFFTHFVLVNLCPCSGHGSANLILVFTCIDV